MTPEEVIAEYMKPDSLVDEGNLLWAATELLAERDRLKRALERIATGRTNEDDEPGQYSIAGYVAQEIAREAMK